MQRIKPKTYIKLSKENFRHNLNILRKKISNSAKIMSVVKANAYGHGIKEVSKILNELEIDWFGVDSLEEALEIRKINKTARILILGYLNDARLVEAVKENISFVLYNFESLEAIIKSQISKPAKIHLKIETGLGRQGVNYEDLPKFLEFIKNFKKKVELEGLSSHFSDFENKNYVKYQITEYKKAEKLVKSFGFFPLRHFAATGAAYMYPQIHMDMVRIGIGLYGLWPTRRLDFQAKRSGDLLKPVLSWYSTIAQIKKVRKGQFIGYGKTWQSQKESIIGVIPIGYYDGYDRGLSNKGSVLVNGKRCPVLGRVAMDMIMVNLDGLKNLKVGDEVVILGRNGQETTTAMDLAEMLNTIPHEILSRINPLIPKYSA